jgi:triosephosphate isomerase
VKKIVVGNWKANLTAKEAETWWDRFQDQVTGVEATVVVCPTFPLIGKLHDLIKGSNFHLGAQTVSAFTHGPYTGEVPVEVLSGLVQYCLIGHSERRKFFQEDNHLIGQKAKLLLEHKIKPIICVENKEDVMELAHLVGGEHLIVAYEPTFAIGTGHPATPIQATQMAEVIKKHFGDSTLVLYGGSVTPEDILDYGKTDLIDGFLVGGASLNPEEFASLIHKVSNTD